MKSFELPGESRVARVQLRTADVERALGFYRGILGLQVSGSTGPEVALSASEQGAAIIVLSEDRAAQPHEARTTGLYHFAIRYPTRPSLAQALQRLARNDYPVEGASDHIVSEAIYLSDPDRNGVELYVDRSRSQWVWRNGQVTMATEPLDLENLLGTIEGQAESVRPPPETDLGHIHLHVADLAPAERFYHDFLGLAVTQRSYPGALFLSAGGYHHHIAVNTWAGRTPAPENSVGLVSYRLEVPGDEVRHGLLERATLGGYETTTSATAAGQELLQIRDPNGNWLEIS